MGWTEVYSKLAVATAKGAQDALTAGQIEKANKLAADSAKFDAKSKQSKSDRFKAALPKIGSVIVGTVGGLLSGGPAGVGAGFVAGVNKAQTLGEVPLTGAYGDVGFETPPIVPQTETPGPVDEGSNFWTTGHWVPFALVAAFLFRKRLGKIFRS